MSKQLLCSCSQALAQISVKVLTEDAAHRPHVHGGGVVRAAQENLRGAVPKSHNLQTTMQTVAVSGRFGRWYSRQASLVIKV